ncbi:hypothetical protein [Gemmatimonas sp.]|uniref:hypothetical protein n=1 Tax=Gemmatimonas sp. TaxID=1962908 RepID=UPI00333FD624
MFTETFAAELSTWSAAVISRLLPTFDNVEVEADEIASAEFTRLGQRPVSEDSYMEMADAAELAYSEGLAHYERMAGVRQGLLNLATAGLYHLFEQQAALLVRKELITPREEHDAEFMTKLLKPGRMITEFEGRLLASGVDLKALSSYTRLDELRLVANVVKHGSGSSAEQLMARVPMLFVHPLLRESNRATRPQPWSVSAGKRSPRVVDRPLAGNDVFVTAKEFELYAAGVVALWAELAELLSA